MIIIFDIILLLILIILAVAAIESKDLLISIILLSAYSLVMALVWVEMSSVDVAFTEASVGAGVSTVLFIAALLRTKRDGSGSVKSITPWFVVIFTGIMLLYGTLDMPTFGDKDAPINKHVAPRYIEKSKEESGVVNMVTAIITNYRGYDTLGETTVIFTAGMSVLLMLRKQSKNNKVILDKAGSDK